MAAVLSENVQYGLSSQGSASENKSLVFVKLTEASQKAIDEYLNLRIKVRKFNPQSKQAEHFDSAPRIFSNPAKKANLHVWITFVFLSHSGTHEIMDYIFSLSVP